MNEKDAVLIPKNLGENFSSGFFNRIFLGGVSRYAVTPLIVALSPGHGDKTRFRQWSSIAIGNHSITPKRFQICSDDWHRWRFWSAFRHFGTNFAESCRMSKSSWMMVPTRSREMLTYSSIDLAEIRLSSKSSWWMWSIISGVLTVLCHPGRGSSQVEKPPHLNWSTQFLTLTYDGTYSPNASVRMAWISFGALPCRTKTWWQLPSPYCWNRLYMLPFSLCNKKRLQFGTWTDPSFQTTLSIPSYDIGK